ncbi:MAG: hypothetical protein QM632_00075 [Micrococcaceae bacterium]
MMWFTILKKCVVISTLALIVVCVIFYAISGVHGTMSAVWGGLTVEAFSGISLVVAVVVSRKHPELLLVSFGAGYIVKIMMFALFFMLIKKPSWLDGAAFVYSALLVLLAWLATEVVSFMKIKRPYFDTAQGHSDGQ